MKLQQKLLTVFTFVGIAVMPAFGQMAGMPGGKMSGKSTPSKATTQKMAMCCMGSMDMGKMKSGGMGKMMANMSAAEKKKMGTCCMTGMKSGSKGMPSGMGSMDHAKKEGKPKHE